MRRYTAEEAEQWRNYTVDVCATDKSTRLTKVGIKLLFRPEFRMSVLLT